MNSDMIKGNWTQLKGEIQKAWGNITGDELEKTKGDLKSIAGIIQQRYGIAKEDASRRLSEMAESVKSSASGVAEKTKDKLDPKTDSRQH